MPLSPAGWITSTPCLQVCPLETKLNYSRYRMLLHAYLAVCRSMTASIQSCVTFFTGCQSKRGLTLRLEYELTYKALNGLAPSYLSEMLMPVAVNLALRRNRSADSGDLTMSRAKNTSYSDRSFAIAAPMLWNSFFC